MGIRTVRFLNKITDSSPGQWADNTDSPFGVSLNDIFTMESLILAQDER